MLLCPTCRSSRRWVCTCFQQSVRGPAECNKMTSYSVCVFSYNQRTICYFAFLFFPDSDDFTHQNNQIESAPGGHRAGLLPAGCVTECLPLSAAEGVILQTTQHKHTNIYTLSLLSYLFSLASTKFYIYFYLKNLYKI